MMTRTSQILVAVLLMFQVCTACVTVYEEEPFCLENGEFSITCPTDHKIIIKKAIHKVVKTGQCPTDLGSIDACMVSDLTKDVSEKCQKTNSCTVPVSDTITTCTGYTGKKFVTVSYKCEPEFTKSVKAKSTGFCSDVSWEGSLAYINNILPPAHATRCQCTVTVAQNVNVEVKRLYSGETCTEFVNMEDEDGQTTDFCMTGELQCKNGGRQLHFEYIPNGQSLVIIGISVSYKASFKLQCSINPVTTTTVATTTPTESTTQENPSTAPTTTTTNKPMTTTTESTTTKSLVTTTTESTVTTTKPPVSVSTTAPENDATTSVTGAKAEAQSGNSGLSQVAVIGIAFGGVFLLIIIMMVACLVFSKQKKKKDDVDPYYQGIEEPRPTSDISEENIDVFTY